MFTFGLAEGARALDPLLLLLLALFLEALAGFARVVFDVLPSPLGVIAALTRVFDRKLNREHRSQTDRAARGVLVTVFLIALCLGASIGVLWVSGHLPYGWALELVLSASLLAQGRTFAQSRAAARLLAAGDIAGARARIERMTGRAATGADEHALCRDAIEATASTFLTGGVAPVFWFVLFGFPGLFVSRAIDEIARHLDRPTDRYRAFGLTAGRLNDALLFIPTRLAVLLLALAAVFAPTAHPRGAMRIMGRDAGKHPSFNIGWPVAAMAGALNVALLGPRAGERAGAGRPWIGDGTARARPHDIRRALYVYGVACLLTLACVAALAVLRYGVPI